MKEKPKARVLIIDDESELRETLETTIQLFLEVEVVTAEDGLDALDAVQRFKPHAILTDLKMPYLDGAGFIQTLRARGIETPTVLLTAHGDTRAALTALRCGAYEFLEKPIPQDELIQCMIQAINCGLRIEALDEQIKALVESGHSEFEDYREERRALIASRNQAIAQRKKIG